MSRRVFLLGLALVAACATAVAAEPAPQWIVVTAPAFRSAIEPLCEQREAEGMDVKLVQTTDVLSNDDIRAGDGRKLRDHIDQLWRADESERYLLLVGAISSANPEDRGKVLPPLRGTIGRMTGQPSDLGYGGVGPDGLPRAAVGRLPARTEAEARGMVQKILAFEHDTRPGAWRRRLTVLAGVPAFNPLVDRLVEHLALSRFDRLHPIWTGRAIYHNPSSRFCLPDERLHDQALDYLQEGQAITLYLGHSWAKGLYAPNARFLDRDDWADLRIERGSGVFITLGCCGCQLAGADGEGYGLAAVRNPHGPVGVIGSHGVCFAAMCQLAADGLLDCFQSEQLPERFAPLWRRMLAGLAKKEIDPLTFRMLDAVDGDPSIPQATQRKEHLEMFLLLGDPAMRLPVMAQEIKLRVADEPGADRLLRVTGELPQRLSGASVRLTLERPITGAPVNSVPVPERPGAERSRSLRYNHERANDCVLCYRQLTEVGGRFEADLELPEAPPWPRVILRAYAVTERDEAVGVFVLPVQP